MKQLNYPQHQARRIVLVDDEEILRWCISLELMALGYHVLSAASWAEGKEAIESHQPNLVICDQGLPDGDGLSLLRDRQLAELKIPAILITAFTPPEASRLLEAGARTCLSKPFDLETLTEAVRRSFCPA